MKKFEPARQIKPYLCDQLGEDVHGKICEELEQYITECPECKIFFDEVKNVVEFYRESETEVDVPEKVQHDLIKKLNLN